MQKKTIRVDMIQANDTYSNWVSSNPIFDLGRISYDSTNKKIKIGDGVTPWNDLPYIGDLKDVDLFLHQLMYNQVIESSPEEWFIFNQDTKTVESLNYDKKEEIELATKIIIPYQIKGVIVENIGIGDTALNVVIANDVNQRINVNNINEIIIPNCIKNINNYCFESWTIQRVNFSTCLENIGKNCFSNCTKLREIIIPIKKIIQIQEGAFSYCGNLKNINDIIECVEEIHSNVFIGCYVNNIEINSNVNKINEKALCNLRRFVVLNNDCIFDGNIFNNESYPEVIQGYKDSTAEIFANNFSIPFIDICGTEVDGGTY